MAEQGTHNSLVESSILSAPTFVFLRAYQTVCSSQKQTKHNIMGIIEHAKKASSLKEIEQIKSKIESYKYASQKTKRRVARLVSQANKFIK